MRTDRIAGDETPFENRLGERVLELRLDRAFHIVRDTENSLRLAFLDGWRMAISQWTNQAIDKTNKGLNPAGAISKIRGMMVRRAV